MARTARTTANLKERIADALLELMSKKPYEDISISEITDLADVGRTTYYRHFTSKDDVLNFKFETIFDTILDNGPHRGLPPKITENEIKQIFQRQLEKIYANRKIFELVYAADLDYLLFRYIYRSATEGAEQNELVDRYYTAFHASAIFALTDQWITSNFAQSPEELVQMLIIHRPPKIPRH